jgi:hypothetical protein
VIRRKTNATNRRRCSRKRTPSSSVCRLTASTNEDYRFRIGRLKAGVSAAGGAVVVLLGVMHRSRPRRTGHVCFPPNNFLGLGAHDRRSTFRLRLAPSWGHGARCGDCCIILASLRSFIPPSCVDSRAHAAQAIDRVMLHHDLDSISQHRGAASCL